MTSFKKKRKKMLRKINEIGLRLSESLEMLRIDGEVCEAFSAQAQELIKKLVSQYFKRYEKYKLKYEALMEWSNFDKSYRNSMDLQEKFSLLQRFIANANVCSNLSCDLYEPIDKIRSLFKKLKIRDKLLTSMKDVDDLEPPASSVERKTFLLQYEQIEEELDNTLAKTFKLYSTTKTKQGRMAWLNKQSNETILTMGEANMKHNYTANFGQDVDENLKTTQDAYKELAREFLGGMPDLGDPRLRSEIVKKNNQGVNQ